MVVGRCGGGTRGDPVSRHLVAAMSDLSPYEYRIAEPRVNIHEVVRRAIRQVLFHPTWWDEPDPPRCIVAMPSMSQGDTVDFMVDRMVEAVLAALGLADWKGIDDE